MALHGLAPLKFHTRQTRGFSVSCTKIIFNVVHVHNLISWWAKWRATSVEILLVTGMWMKDSRSFIFHFYVLRASKRFKHDLKAVLNPLIIVEVIQYSMELFRESPDSEILHSTERSPL